MTEVEDACLGVKSGVIKYTGKFCFIAEIAMSYSDML